jgi:hypothetical protein
VKEKKGLLPVLPIFIFIYLFHGSAIALLIFASGSLPAQFLSPRRAASWPLSQYHLLGTGFESRWEIERRFILARHTNAGTAGSVKRQYDFVAHD